jgi:hypothetical protein
MKLIYKKIKSSLVKKQQSQQDVIEFIHDEKNIQKAVEGSMQKRIDLIDRVSLHKTES